MGRYGFRKIAYIDLLRCRKELELDLSHNAKAIEATFEGKKELGLAGVYLRYGAIWQNQSETLYSVASKACAYKLRARKQFQTTDGLTVLICQPRETTPKSKASNCWSRYSAAYDIVS